MSRRGVLVLMNTLHYGIIGCGVIGPVHAAALAELPDARLVGVCDIRRERAEQVAAEYHVPFLSTDYLALLARPDIDAVCICTPHYLHAEMAVAAAQAGKHVFCEKPMAIDPADMTAMIVAAERAGVQLGICFQHRFDPVAMQLKVLVDSGKFGQLLLGGAHCRCVRNEAYYRSETWRGTWAQEGGGVLINQAIHTIDLLLWLFGEATSVYGQYATLRWGETIEVEDTATGVISFRGGAQGHIAATSASNLDWNTRLHIYGTAGSAVVNTGYPDEFTFIQLSEEIAAVANAEPVTPLVGKACYGTSHQQALQSFTAAVLSGQPFPIPGQQARHAAEVVLALYRSAREGRPVALPLGEGNVITEAQRH